MDETKTVIPKIAWLTVNRSCNFRCRWCYAKETKYTKDSVMTQGYAEKILTICKELGIKDVIVIGGEPTLWSHLIEINIFCKKQGIKTTIATNAVRFSNDNFWNLYTQNPNDSVGISIKGFSKENLKLVAGTNNFNRSVTGIKRGLTFFKSGVSVVYNTLCVDNLLDLAKFAMDCGSNFLTISPCTPTFGGTWVESEFVVDLKKVVANITRDYEKLHEITHGRLSFFMKLPLCIWPRSFIENLIAKHQITTVCQLQQRAGIIFDANGDVMMCNGLFKYPIGTYSKNFTDSKTLVEFLNSKEINEYYNVINSYPSKKCIGCPMYIKCGGGCPLIWTVHKPEEVITGW